MFRIFLAFFNSTCEVNLVLHFPCPAFSTFASFVLHFSVLHFSVLHCPVAHFLPSTLVPRVPVLSVCLCSILVSRFPVLHFQSTQINLYVMYCNVMLVWAYRVNQ